MLLITALSYGVVNNTSPQISKMSEEVLRNSIQQDMSTVAEYGVYIKDLSTNKVIEINSDKQMHAASIGKILVAVCALEKIQNKKLSENRIPDIKLMMNISDNNAWDRLNYTLGFNYLDTCAKNYHMTGTWVFDNLSTAKDTGELLNNVYTEKILNPTFKAQLLSFMQNTENERFISKSIPNDITFYHKAGTFEGEVHDAAIVEAKTPYILVIFTNDTSGSISWATRESILNKISKKVYEFFSY